MKKFIVTLLMFAMCLSLFACTHSESVEESSSGNTNLIESSVADTNYTISIPSDFDIEDNSGSYIIWNASDYEKTNYQITAYDVGHYTFVNDNIPTTFEEWSQKEIDEGVTHEELFFEYNDGDKYEEYTVVAKITYTEGSIVYDLAKTNHNIEQLDVDTDESNDTKVTAFPEKIEECFGRKVIINKEDRSMAIIAVVESNDINDANELKQVLTSFNWK